MCNSKGNVESIALPNMALHGNVSFLEKLDSILKVDLEGNNFFGTMPSLNIDVEMVNICTNLLVGSLPSFSKYSKLAEINLSENSFVGSFPLWNSNIPQINLSENRLTGSIPSLAGYPRLTGLALRTNRFTGTIPSFSENKELKILSLELNLLTGTVPSFSTNQHLFGLYLALNQLGGTIPTFSQNYNLLELSLWSNQLSGVIPSFSSNTVLQQLALYENNLSGEIPSFYNNADLSYLALRYNQLSGTIPSFSNNGYLQELYLYSNSLSGSIPTFSSNTKLSVLSLASNQLHGSVPSFLGNTALAKLDLHSNNLTGEVPEFDSLKNLDRLDLSANRLKLDDVSFPKIPFVNLSNNAFSGSCEVFDIPELALVDISGNSFVCPYPKLRREQTVIRDQCRPNWTIITPGLIAGAVLLFVSVAALSVAACTCRNALEKIRRISSNRKLKTIYFWVMWTFGIFGVVSDTSLGLSWIQYSLSQSPNCSGMTKPDLFLHILPITYSFDGWPFPNTTDTVTSFANYVELVAQRFPNRYPSVNVAFLENSCKKLDASCQFANFECQSLNGANSLAPFLATVYVWAALTIFKELTRVFCILWLCVRGEGVVHGGLRVFLRSSIFSPILSLGAFRKESQQSFSFSIVHHEGSPVDFWLEFVYNGLLKSLPLLVLAYYFLYYIMERGLSVMNYVSYSFTLCSAFWQLLKAFSATCGSLGRSRAGSNEQKLLQ